MLNTWVNLTATQLLQKQNGYIISTLRTTQQNVVYKLYYELKNLNTLSFFEKKINVFLISLFVPYGVTIKQIFLYKTYLEYLNKSYKFLRLLYNLPVRKVRTHSVSRRPKWVSTLCVNYCVKTTRLFKRLKLPLSKIKLLFFCEFINSLWFVNWWKDWFSAYRTRVKSVSKNTFIKWKYDLVGLQQGHAILFTTKKKKAKHNRRKAIVLKNTYNIGFNYGFSLIHVKRILSNLQKN